jgi:hypothetical protein
VQGGREQGRWSEEHSTDAMATVASFRSASMAARSSLWKVLAVPGPPGPPHVADGHRRGVVGAGGRRRGGVVVR